MKTGRGQYMCTNIIFSQKFSRLILTLLDSSTTRKESPDTYNIAFVDFFFSFSYLKKKEFIKVTF